MPSSASLNKESRSATKGKKRKPTSDGQRQKKRRKKKSQMNESTQAADPVTNRAQSSKQDQPTSNRISSTMTEGFGRNRLATGFEKPSGSGRKQDTKTSAQTSQDKSRAGESADSAIPLTDDEEMQDSEGGIDLRVKDRNGAAPTITLSDDDDDNSDEYEAGEVSDRQSENSDSRANKYTSPDVSSGTEQPSFMVDTMPMNATKKLVDLAPAQREEQIKYAFYHLARDEIDLSRPVICLRCFDQGHLKEDCQHNPTFPKLQVPKGQSIKLWISCCICASKSHLVGDCPDVGTVDSTRWSLSKLDPSQIINLSLESGTRTLEKEAENRGMRPQGLSIKGRAGRHTAGFGHREDEHSENSDDQLNHLGKRSRIDNPQDTRYDRFDAPSQPLARPRGSWYATDSFGRRRSRSPPQDSRSARDRRFPSPPSNTYRPDYSHSGGDQYRREPPRQRQSAAGRPRVSNNAQTTSSHGGGRAPTSKKLPPPSIPRPAFTINLPTRKGSNSWANESPAQSSSSIPSNSAPNHTNAGKKKKKKPRRHQAQNGH